MAAPLTQFQKKMAARRGTSSIERLSRQYQEQIKNITGEYETSFANYTKKRAEAMAPFESATEQYKKDYATYESNVSGYKGRLGEYQAKLEEIKKNPTETVSFYYQKDPRNPSFQQLVVPGVGTFKGVAGTELPSGYSMDYGSNTLYRAKTLPAFTEKAPTAPERPVAPKIPEFEANPFEEKKAQAEEVFKRETAERKAARLSAVSRKETRPLLQGKA